MMVYINNTSSREALAATYVYTYVYMHVQLRGRRLQPWAQTLASPTGPTNADEDLGTYHALIVTDSLVAKPGAGRSGEGG